MTLTHIQPQGLLELPGLTQVIVASGSRHVFVAGQAPVTPDGILIGPGDLAEQTRAVCERLQICLSAAGATVGDLVRMTIYVVDFDESALDAIYAGAAAVFGENLPAPTSTLLGVAALLLPGQRIEIDAIAVLG